jgi:hypothetical protein
MCIEIINNLIQFLIFIVILMYTKYTWKLIQDTKRQRIVLEKQYRSLVLGNGYLIKKYIEKYKNVKW